MASVARRAIGSLRTPIQQLPRSILLRQPDPRFPAILFFSQESFVGSSQPRCLKSLSQHSMILSLTTIRPRPFLKLGPKCPWLLEASPRKAAKEQSAVVASHVWSDSCLLLPKASYLHLWALTGRKSFRHCWLVAQSHFSRRGVI